MRKPLLIAKQGRRPSGLLGRLVARIMARETAPENDRALALLKSEPGDEILEIGSGHGHTLARAATMAPDARFTGVDFSEVMHRYAARRHRARVAQGQLTFLLGSSDKLPFPTAHFDKVLTVHTIYFWTSPLDHLREARRVLRPGGRLVLGFRPAEDPGFGATFPAEVYCIRPRAEVIDFVERAGFQVLEVDDPVIEPRRVVLVLAKAM